MQLLAPADAFRDHFKVVVCGAKHLQFAQFSDSGRNSVEVNLVAVDEEFAEPLQLAQRRLKEKLSCKLNTSKLFVTEKMYCNYPCQRSAKPKLI